MAAPQDPIQMIADNEDNDRFLSDDQLLSRTARYLRVLEQRMQEQQGQPQEHQIDPQQVEKLYTKRKLLRAIHELLAKSHKLIQGGNAKGFVYGLIAHGSTWAASSDSLRTWWKEDVNFEKNGPLKLSPADSEQTLELIALYGLQDTTLSSMISALMQKCRPPQRSCKFEKGVPVEWWPDGTEDWYAQVNLEKDSGRPPYRKPHDLRKPWKVAVLVAAIKNMAPAFDKMRALVSQSQTLQNKMNTKETEIWLGVLRGEEQKHRTGPKIESFDSTDTGGLIVSDLCETETETETVPVIGSSTHQQGPIETSSLDGGINMGANRLKRIAVAEPETAPAGKNTAIFVQGPIETSMSQMLREQVLPNQSNAIVFPTNFNGGLFNSVANNKFWLENQYQWNSAPHSVSASSMNFQYLGDSIQPWPVQTTTFPAPYTEPGPFGLMSPFGSNINQMHPTNGHLAFPPNSMNPGIQSPPLSMKVGGVVSILPRRQQANFVQPIGQAPQAEYNVPMAGEGVDVSNAGMPNNVMENLQLGKDFSFELDWEDIEAFYGGE